jgi:hypothetical protein
MIQWKNHVSAFTGAHQHLDNSFILIQQIAVFLVADAPPLITVSARFTTPENISARFKEPFGPYLLLEDGSGVLLLEDGFKLLLEPDPTDEFVTATFKTSTTTKANY